MAWDLFVGSDEKLKVEFHAPSAPGIVLGLGVVSLVNGVGLMVA
jgi:hypothetical protein